MKMLKSLALSILLMLPLFVQAQNIELKMVQSDSLVHFLRRQTGERIYFLRGEESKPSYTVSAPAAEFLQAGLDALASGGYTVTHFDGAYYVMKDKGIAMTLPDGYFNTAEPETKSDDLLRYVDDNNTSVSFQNKIYEIGEAREGLSGKVYVAGYIRDVTSGEPIIGASVFDEKTGTYSLTDPYGFYRILLPVGENVLTYSAYSMEDLKLNVIVHSEGGLDVVMKEKVTALKEAVVSADALSFHRSARMGIETVRINVIKKIPSVFGEADILKGVLTLPGVKSVGEAATGFNVRGGSVDQNLILFNDGTVFNPSHMFGIVSSFNADVINDAELYKSSIPVEYGGRISSVLDVRGRSGNSNKLAGSLGLGLLMSSFHLEGPLSKGRTTFILGGRTTYSNWLMNFLPENSGYSGGRASFSDVNLGVSHKVNERNSIHAYGYWSRDRFSFSKDTTFRYSNINASLKWRSNFNDSNSLTFTAGYDQYNNGIDEYSNAARASAMDFSISQYFAKLGLKSLLSGGAHTLDYGLHGIMYDLDPGHMDSLDESSFVVAKSLPHQRAMEMAAFFGDTWMPGSRVSLEAGVRASGFFDPATKSFYGAPEFRMSGKYSMMDNLSMKAGFNTMRQYIHLITNTSSISPVDTWTLCTDRIKPQDGWQAAGGLYWTVPAKTVDISVESYFKHMDNSLDYKAGAVLVMNDHLADDLVQTEGKAYGVEMMLRKSTGMINGWISYTYSRSFLREKEDRGIGTINGGAWYPAPHDKPHDVKVVSNFKFTHRYSLSVNLDYSTGRPVTIPIGKYYYGGGMRLAYSDRNGYRIPDYFRMDVALNIEPGHYLKQLTHMAVVLGVYNVTGRKNAYSVFYSTEKGTDVTGHMMSVFATQIPYINLNLKF